MGSGQLTPGPPVEIVEFAPEHSGAFRALVAAVLPEFGFHEDREIDRDLADPAAHYDAIWIALEGAVVVGSVAMRHVGDRAVELKRMYVRPGLRGRGLGRRLLDVALEWARSEGAGASSWIRPRTCWRHVISTSPWAFDGLARAWSAGRSTAAARSSTRWI